ncbi:MAG: hypothetical protein WDN31_12200, partial [Hyphomicrobium sp.]
VALTASGPRFLTLGDEARLDIAVHNVEGPEAAYKLDLTNAEKSVHTASLDLKAGERRATQVAVKPDAVGLIDYDIRVTGPNGIDVKRHLTFDVKPPAGDIKRTTVASLKPGGNVQLSADLIADMIASRTRVSIAVGPTATLDIPSLLTSLDRYPYGCAEQTVSRALPLIYANQVAVSLGIAPDKEIRARVQKAVDRVFEMQDSSGAFGVWGPYNTDLWLTGYVTDFLTRAKEQGFAVNPLGFSQALDRLQNFIAYAEDFQKGGEDRAYALYVLARNGRAPIGDLRYYADTRLDRFSTPLAKAQLGAALAMMGDKPPRRAGLCLGPRRPRPDRGDRRPRRRLPRRLRLRPARQRRPADARLGDARLDRRGAQAHQRRRQGVHGPQLYLDAGAGLAAARRQRHGRGRQGP